MKSLLFLSLLLAPSNAASQEELRDILLGASHAINHAPQTEDEYYASTFSLGAGATRQQHEKMYSQERRTKSIKQNDNNKEGNRSNRQWQQKKLVSTSFEAIANTLGFAADTLRVTGDTAAGVLGSSIKLVGTAVKSTGSQFDNAGNWISPKNKHNNKYGAWQRQHTLTSRKSWNQNGTPRRREMLLHGSRSMAARSVKLMGSVVREFGDMLLFTGAATESIGSMTAAVAEDSLRILEDFADSIADHNDAPPTKERVLVRPRRDPVNEGPSISYGTHEFPAPGFSEEINDDAATTMTEAVLSTFAFLNQETGGVPSQAPELFVVFVLCYIGAALTFGNKKERAEHQIVIKHDLTDFSWLGLAASLALLPFRLAFLLLRLLLCIVFSRYTILLFFYLLAWLHVCHMSQIRSRSIHSSAESKGYRFALSSLQAVNPSMREPAVWLNTVLKQIWRVPSPECPPYPDFVRDGIHGCGQDPVECIDGTCQSYGGLEPYLAWSIGDALTTALDTSRVAKPRNIAFASLHSISLGSTPPLIRYVEILGESEDGRYTDFLIEFDMSLEDLRMVLEIKLSSLEYALLPTTKIAVGSLVSNLKLKVRTTTTPDTPFLSTIQLSLVHLPDSSLRITPLGDESGLKGIDLGSVPLIREWIQGAIRNFLSAYVSPKYVSVDLLSWYKQPSIAKLASSMPFKPSRRRAATATRHATKLFGGQDLLKAAQPAATLGEQMEPISARFPRPSLVKPKTQAAKLGMDRWMESMHLEDHTARSDEDDDTTTIPHEPQDSIFEPLELVL